VSKDSDPIEQRLRIADVLYRYATALDARDWGLLTEVFAEGATYSIGAYGVVRGVDAIAAKIAELIGGYESTQHLVANPVIEVDGSHARSTSYVRAYHHWTGDDHSRNKMEIGGVYRDELVSTPHGWRITHRVLEVNWRDGAAIVPSGPSDLDGSGDPAAR
jgi:SnoaL-like protein